MQSPALLFAFSGLATAETLAQFLVLQAIALTKCYSERLGWHPA